MNTNHYQTQVLNGLQLKNYLDKLPAEEFTQAGYYKGFKFLNRHFIGLKNLEPIKDDKYILLLDISETEHNIVGVINLQNINKPYYYDSKKVFDTNNINIQWEIDYIEIRRDYQNKGLVKLLLQGISTAVLSHECFYITNFTDSGLKHHLNIKMAETLPNYKFYLITSELSNITVSEPVITLLQFNSLITKEFI